MRLELNQISGPPLPGRPRYFMEHGSVTMGRAPDCEWIVEDEACTVSKHHCRVERDRSGYLLLDSSANGTKVGERLVLEGQSARILHGMTLTVGAFTFQAHVSGDNEHDRLESDVHPAASDDGLTISAILSDISPGGPSATGILGRDDGEDWSTRALEPRAPRTVDIGWDGPPATGDHAALPDDWDKEFDRDFGKDPGGAFDQIPDSGSRFEHADAARTAVPISNRKAGQIASPEPVVQAEPVDLAFDAIFDEAFRAPAMERKSVASLDTDAPSPLSLDRQEAALERICAALGMEADMPGRGIPAPERLTALARLWDEAALRIEQLTAAFGQMLDPDMIEARVAAEKSLLGKLVPGQHDAACWRAYRRQFDQPDRKAGMHGALFSAPDDDSDKADDKQ